MSFGLTANRLPFYILIFLGTCLYYTIIYLRSVGAKNYNERTLWYRSNFALIKKVCLIALLLVAAFFIYFVFRNIGNILGSPPFVVILLLVFPALAGWYTFVPSYIKLKQIRQYGWFKPFVVSITWAGFTTIYPVLTWQMQHTGFNSFDHILLFLLFLQNLFFFLVIAILFDLKDYRIDARYGLNTFAVLLGIRKTLRYIVWPFVIFSLVLFVLLHWHLGSVLSQWIIQLIPLIGLMFTVANYRQQKKVLYYLVAVDGWIFVKALTGIASMLILK